MGILAPIRVRREPETTVLYQVLATHLETFVARTAADERRAGLPGFVVRSLRCRGKLQHDLLDRLQGLPPPATG